MGQTELGTLKGARDFVDDFYDPPILQHPVGTIKGLVSGCTSGYHKWGGGRYGVLQCVDNDNPYVNIRRGFEQSFEEARDGCLEQSAEDFYDNWLQVVFAAKDIHEKVESGQQGSAPR